MQLFRESDDAKSPHQPSAAAAAPRQCSSAALKLAHAACPTEEMTSSPLKTIDDRTPPKNRRETLLAPGTPTTPERLGRAGRGVRRRLNWAMQARMGQSDCGQEGWETQNQWSTSPSSPYRSTCVRNLRSGLAVPISRWNAPIKRYQEPKSMIPSVPSPRDM